MSVFMKSSYAKPLWGAQSCAVGGLQAAQVWIQKALWPQKSSIGSGVSDSDENAPAIENSDRNEANGYKANRVGE